MTLLGWDDLNGRKYIRAVWLLQSASGAPAAWAVVAVAGLISPFCRGAMATFVRADWKKRC